VRAEWNMRLCMEIGSRRSLAVTRPVFLNRHAGHGRASNLGFTLIEMLVVLLIMGLLVGMVSSIAQPDAKARLRVESERLAQLLNIAETESRLTGQSIAWTADGPSYRFLRFSEDLGWTEITDDHLLRARILPTGMLISNMRVENMATPEHMRVEFSAYGSVLAFTVDMSIGNVRFTVSNSPIGDVRVIPEIGEPDETQARR
jgi:general secretion pathway protein H